MMTMKSMLSFALTAAMGLAFASFAQAETKVTVSNVHLCCGACVKAVDKAIQGVEGATAVAAQGTHSIAITAESDAAAQNAIDALADAGFHGETDSETIKYKDDTGAEAGLVKRLELTGVHNCCGSCNVAIKKAIGTVDGVEASTAKPKQTSFVVEGNFDGKKLVSALLDAGFHVKVKK
ncbi:cation transporter [Lignipirellula cremea]|uniref:Copper exporting ATPase n=1 Tax=Lignipirellula cremea TaxID=2528010 RepID=A0A518DMI5_9BACT|nr:cation transporter [Lignipirellula cremea]QDU93049.1 copper exporting ATPase [Lignipirellula cremea]